MSNLLAIAARAQLLAAFTDLTDDHAIALAALVKLGSPAALRVELSGIADPEAKGTTHALAPLGSFGSQLYTKGLLLDVYGRVTRGT